LFELNTVLAPLGSWSEAIWRSDALGAVHISQSPPLLDRVACSCWTPGRVWPGTLRPGQQDRHVVRPHWPKSPEEKLPETTLVCCG